MATPLKPTADAAQATIAEQLQTSISGSLRRGGQQLTVQLEPPELGRVSIKFTERSNELSGLLEATRPETRAQIRQAIPELIRSLEQSGINIKRLDVTLSDSSKQSPQQSLRDNSSQQLLEQSGHQNFHGRGENYDGDDAFVPPGYRGNIAQFGQDTSSQQLQFSSSNEMLDVLV